MNKDEFMQLFRDGNEHQKNGEYHNALNCYDKFLRSYSDKTPQLAATLYNKGVVLIKLKNFSNAISCFNESINIFNNFKGYTNKIANNYYNIGYCYLHLDNYFMSYKNYLKYKKLIPNDITIDNDLEKLKNHICK